MPYSYPQFSFVAGEWSPALCSRVDMPNYQHAASDITNMIVLPQGGVTRRPGTVLVGDVIAPWPDYSGKYKLLPFQFSSDQAYMMLVESWGIRVIKDRGFVLADQKDYIDNAKWVQVSGDIYKCTYTVSASAPHNWPTGQVGYTPPQDLINLHYDNTDSEAWLGPAAVYVPASGGVYDSLTRAAGASNLALNEWYWDNVGYGSEFYLYVNVGGKPGSGGVPTVYADYWVTIDHPYTGATDFTKLRWTQRADVMYLFHPSHKTNKIVRTSDTEWANTELDTDDWKGDADKITSVSIFGSNESKYKSLVNSRYSWHQSKNTGYSNAYYLLLADGSQTEFTSRPATKVVETPPTTTEYFHVFFNGPKVDETSTTSMFYKDDLGTANHAQWADHDGLGFETLYVHLSSSELDPSKHDDGYIMGFWDDQTYAATAVYDDGEESVLSGTVKAGIWNTVRWQDDTEASHYNIYRRLATANDSRFGWVGSESRVDTSSYGYFYGGNIKPDLAKGPPTEINPFKAASGTIPDSYPGVGCFHEQRLILARAYSDPGTFWGTALGFYSNLTSQLPVRDDDAFEFTLASQQANDILWVVSFKDLVIGTTGGEWLISGSDGGAITPLSISARCVSQWGSADIPAVIAGDTVLFAQRGGKAIRDLSYSTENAGFVGSDLTVFARHLFDESSVAAFDFQRLPVPVLWVVMRDGTMKGLTWSKAHRVFAWHKHTTQTGDSFKDVAVMPGVYDEEDDAYFLVQRESHSSATDRVFVEVLGKQFQSETYSERSLFPVFLDSCIYSTLSGPTNSVSGLEHLEGCVVYLVLDGEFETDTVNRHVLQVSDGKVTWSGDAATYVVVGRTYESSIETVDALPPVKNGVSTDRHKAVASAYVLLQDTRTLTVAPGGDLLNSIDTQVSFVNTAAAGSPPDLFTGGKEVIVAVPDASSFRLLLKTSQPLSLTVLSLIARTDTGVY